MGVLENSTIAQTTRKRRVSVSSDDFSRNKHKRENILDVRATDNLTSISPLNEDSVLNVIEARFQRKTFYSWAGVPLVGVNPFEYVTELYDEAMLEKYRTITPDEIKEYPPHIFAVGRRAFCDLERNLDTRNQSIVISGESGAGKTWTTRHLMRFFTKMADTRTEENNAVNKIEKRILDSNPILEAFGNAQTVRNKNSSRFGKFIQLQYDRCQRIVGATINTYLLEKTRVAHQAQGERNFHIFEQIAKHEGHTGTLNHDESSFGELEKTKQALEHVGIGNQLQSEIFKVLRGILELCEVQFLEENDTCSINDVDFRGSSACKLLEIDAESLKQCLCSRRITTGLTGEQFMKPCLESECEERRDCMAKLIYSRLFDWIVTFINASIKAPPDSKYSFIGLLDIYGFENFDSNSLEQLCINYANEKLQQHFVYHFMKAQQEEYQKEGVEWSFQDFVDNRPCLDLIEGRISIFSLMNEECRLKREQDANSFISRLETSLANSNHFTCPKFRHKTHQFAINHFAETVSYQADELLKKNKDFIPPEVIELLQTSRNVLIQELFQFKDSEDQMENQRLDGDSNERNYRRRRQTTVTVVHKFKVSLDSLMSTLRSTNVHYIRCIKPNTRCQPGVFDRKQVVSQLNACGVLETIRISAAGYPIRISHREFLKRYSLTLKHLDPGTRSHMPPPLALSPKKDNGHLKGTPVERLKRRSRRRHRSSYDHSRQICRSIVEVVGLDEAGGCKENKQERNCERVKIGRTKVFLQESAMARLEEARNECLVKSLLIIQSCWRRYKRKLTKKRKAAAVTIQSVWRDWMAKRNFQRRLKAAQVIQHYIRRYLALKRSRERCVAKLVGGISENQVNAGKLSPAFTKNNCTDLKSVERLQFLSADGGKGCQTPSWFDQLDDTKNGKFTPTCSVFLGSKRFTLSSVRGHQRINPLAALMSNCNAAKINSQGSSANKQNLGIQTVNRSSAILSRRDIAKTPVAFHCKGTPLPHANTRPHQGTTTSLGLAGISEMVD
ncbi:unconventional myosin-XIX-like isoform X1 [Acropora palmata]|uniref:unconventional myosin-XIX-like isoform X1 n=1 Tax=Acropora palmata TaxID=6131 RepID=UPI003DA09C09